MDGTHLGAEYSIVVKKCPILRHMATELTSFDYGTDGINRKGEMSVQSIGNKLSLRTPSQMELRSTSAISDEGEAIEAQEPRRSVNIETHDEPEGFILLECT